MLLAIFVLAGWGGVKLPVLRCAMVMVAGPFLLHAMALNASVLAARKGRVQRNTSGLVIVMIALVLVFPAIELMTGVDKQVEWWRLRIASIDFLLASVTAYAAWAVLGAYRSMCGELEIRTMPWAILAFIGFTAVYLAGFFVRGPEEDASGLNAILLSGVVVSLGIMYLLLFGEQTGAGAWQRQLSRSRSREWRGALEELPVWFVALAAGLVLATAATPLQLGGVTSTLLRNIELAPLAVTLFAVRDAALFQFFAFARQPRRAEAATLFYLVLLYWLVPGLLSAVGATAAADLVLPPLLTRPGFATAVIAVHAAIAISLAIWRWRRNHAVDREYGHAIQGE